MLTTTKITLVTVIAAFELQARLAKDLKAAGVKGYTVGKVDGHGTHGHRAAGIADASSIRIEMLVSPTVAEAILKRLASEYADQPLIAYVQEVQAMPAEHFTPTA